jgi:hypothetical protein
MVIITQNEISEHIKDMYTDTKREIICKHDPLKGEKDFVLCIIEQSVGLLERNEVDDQKIIIYAQSLLSVASEEFAEYDVYLDMMCIEPHIIKLAHCGEILTRSERKIVYEMMQSNLGEYLLKADFQLCCYSAMKVFLIGLYCILVHGIDFSVGSIDLLVDLDDELRSINLFECKEEKEFVIVNWHSTNKINNIFTLYKIQYSGLEPESILDLVSADVIEEDYYFKDMRFTIAPSILMKQYLSIIEREVNIIIRLSNAGNKNGAHLKWYDMKNRVRKKGIDIDFLPYKLHEPLDALYQYRNGTMHGETDITSLDYEVLLKYKRKGLFMGISIKKLELRGIEIKPSIDDNRENDVYLAALSTISDSVAE